MSAIPYTLTTAAAKYFGVYNPVPGDEIVLKCDPPIKVLVFGVTSEVIYLLGAAPSAFDVFYAESSAEFKDHRYA